MNNRLLIVGLAGLAVSVVCLTVGGVQMSRVAGVKDGDWISRLVALGIGEDACPVDGGPEDSRSFNWDGGDRAEIGLPANVHYKPGSGEQVILRGDKAVLSHVTLKNGHLRLDCNLGRHGDRLDVTLPGREFRTFALNGSGRLELQDIDQHALNIRVAGSGEIEGNGKTDNLDITIAGSGDVRLGLLAAQNVRVSVAGSGDLEVAPHGDLDVNIAGSGKVVLKSEPQHIDTHIAGSGKIIHDAAPAQGDGKTDMPVPDMPKMPDTPAPKKG